VTDIFGRCPDEVVREHRELVRYRKETGGLVDTHPGLVAKALDTLAHCWGHGELFHGWPLADLAALRAATFEATE